MSGDRIESSGIYLVDDARMELIDLWVTGLDEPFNYMELSMDYSYVDDSGETVTHPIAPLCLDMDMLIEFSAMISRAMVRLEDANPVQSVGWDEQGDDPRNAGNPLD